MADGMDLAELRDAVGKAMQGLTMFRHAELDEAFERLGLPQTSEGTKSERVSQSFAALPDTALPMVAERILTSQQLHVDAVTCNAIQDVLWAAQDTREIPKRTWREIPGPSISPTSCGMQTGSVPSWTACGCWVTTRSSG
jgi:hypothetical protein